MESKTLRVRARGAALVHCLEAMNASPRRYIGREWVETDGVWGLAPLKDAVEVPDRAEYRQAVRDGDLWAADQATAAECGVAFDPSFGGAEPLPNALKRTARVAEKD